jgi:multiple sugar transport system substrate-binding protein
MTKKRLAISVLALLVVAVVASGATQARPAGTTTVTLSGWASSPTETDLLKQTISAFERRYPSIKVEYAPISGDYPAAMLAKFAARQPPDVFYVDSNVVPDWIKQGVLEPLDGYISKTKYNTKPFFPRLLNAFKGPDGKTYGFPKDWSPLAMETNNELFRRANATVPRNWTQLKQAALKLRSVMPQGARPICLSNSWDRLLAFVYQNKGGFLNAPKTKSLVQTKQTKQAVQFYVNLISSGLAGVPSQLGVGWCGEALGKERAAIVFEGNWVVPFMETDFPKTSYSINRMIRNRQEGNLAFTVSYSIGRHAKNKDAAWTLLSFLAGKDGMGIWTSKGLALPSRADVKVPPGRGPFIASAPAARPWQFKPGFAKVVDVANSEIQAAIEGKKSIDDALKATGSAIDDALG